VKFFVEGRVDTLPGHIAKLQRLREACRGLGVDVTDTQFTGVTTLSMSMPSCDPVIGTVSRMIFYYHPNIIATHRVAITLLYIEQNVYGLLWVPGTI